MRWEDERYVRVYVRDTADWLALGWEAQALFMLSMRKCDRAGLLDLGKAGTRGLAALVGMPHEVVQRALPTLVEDGCVSLNGSTLVIRNFIEAQEASQSDAQRKRESRGRARDRAATSGHESGQVVEVESRTVTASPGSVTSGHAESQVVTPSCAVPCRAEPISLSHSPARAREAAAETERPRASAEPEPSSPRALGEAHRLAILAPKPLTAQLIAELERRGFECSAPVKAGRGQAVERAVAEVGVPLAADRVMAKVANDRALRVVPHDTLGWFLDDIRGQPEGGSAVHRDTSTGVAAPAPAAAFGDGGERAIE